MVSSSSDVEYWHNGRKIARVREHSSVEPSDVDRIQTVKVVMSDAEYESFSETDQQLDDELDPLLGYISDNVGNTAERVTWKPVVQMFDTKHGGKRQFANTCHMVRQCMGPVVAGVSSFGATSYNALYTVSRYTNDQASEAARAVHNFMLSQPQSRYDDILRGVVYPISVLIAGGVVVAKVVSTTKVGEDCTTMYKEAIAFDTAQAVAKIIAEIRSGKDMDSIMGEIDKYNSPDNNKYVENGKRLRVRTFATTEYDSPQQGDCSLGGSQPGRGPI